MTKFHLDEHVSSALAAALRMHGFDVSTAADAGLLEAEDEVTLNTRCVKAALSLRTIAIIPRSLPAAHLMRALRTANKRNIRLVSY